MKITYYVDRSLIYWKDSFITPGDNFRIPFTLGNDKTIGFLKIYESKKDALDSGSKEENLYEVIIERESNGKSSNDL